MDLMNQLVKMGRRPSSVQSNRRKIAHATAKLKQDIADGEEVYRRPLREVMEASTSGQSRGAFTSRHDAHTRRHSESVNREDDDDILSSLVRTRRWSSPEVKPRLGQGARKSASKTGSKGASKTSSRENVSKSADRSDSKNGREPGRVSKQVKKGSFLPPLQNKVVERGVKKAWTDGGRPKRENEESVQTVSRTRSPLAPLGNGLGGPGSQNRTPSSSKPTDQKREAKTEGNAKSEGGKPSSLRGENEDRESEKREGRDPCRCKNCLECILRPRRPRGRRINGSMMVTLSLPDDQGWTVQGQDEIGDSEGDGSGYASSRSGSFSAEEWTESDGGTKAGSRGSWADRPLTLEELESEAPMEEYRREKLELWFRSKPETAAEDPAHQAVVLDIKRMLRQNPLMRPAKATRQTFERLASPREASEQMDREEDALLAVESQQQHKRALRAFMREQRAKAAQHLARRREQEELARAQIREEEERRATLRMLVGKYVAVEARRKLRAYQSEQQKRMQKAANLRQNPAQWHQF